MSFGKTEVVDSDRIYEGLRIPSSLKNVTSVSFVLTQESGKLKPKDLKVAIEKNRAEKEQRAEEQRKLREEGGGAGVWIGRFVDGDIEIQDFSWSDLCIEEYAYKFRANQEDLNNSSTGKDKNE